MTLASTFGRSLGRAHLRLDDRLSQSDRLLERLSAVHTKYHHEQISCKVTEIKVQLENYIGRNARVRSLARYANRDLLPTL